MSKENAREMAGAVSKETNREMEGLIRSQHELYGRIARSYENLRKVGTPNITIGLVEARLQALESNWAKFEAQHEKIYAGYWEILADHDYEKKDVPSTAEEAYIQQKGMFLETLRKLKSKAEGAPAPAAAGTNPPRTTLPRIQLPEFEGKYEEWPAFRDLFHSIIGKDAATTPVEKLHYLKSCLKGEAELLVRSLPTTDENFERAWKTLTDYYQNKRLLVRSYLAQFTSLQKLKGESVSELRKVYHRVVSTVGALDSIGRPISRSEDLFVHLVVDLLDPRSRREWENAVSETPDPPSFAVLQQFLDRRLHTLESLQPAKPENATSAKAGGNSAQQTRALHAKAKENRLGRCSVCQKGHFIMFCAAYKGKTAAERKQHVEANNLCLNCLGKHKLNECDSKRNCSVCDGRHHSSLHDAYQGTEVATTSHLAQGPSENAVAVLLATARVRVRDRFGIERTARALIDQGSESSLVAESLVQRLKLSRAPASVAVFGVGGKRTARARGLVTLEISPRGGGPSIAVSALILPRLSLYGGGIRADKEAWTHLRGLELADPEFLGSDPVDFLLGADVVAEILQPGLLKGGAHEPVAQKTALGWIISGAAGAVANPEAAVAHQCHVDAELSALVQGFWRQEELPVGPPALTREEQEAEDFFARTHSRTAEGRFVVRLPVVNPLPDLRGTRNYALRVLTQMERRLSRDEKLKSLYVDFMRQYEELGHMTPVAPDKIAKSRVCYLPHHGVMREASSSTKLRVVFNGSAALPSGDSLNRYLRAGPNLLPALADVLLRWRRYRYVLATDVEKMYRQILVHEEDRDLQRILWRYHTDEKIREYILNTVTYGLTCSPFQAIRALLQLAEDEKERFPLAALALLGARYMDEVLSGADTLEEAMALRQQLTELCAAGGFPLRKWSANDEMLKDCCALAGGSSTPSWPTTNGIP
ncbi:uncharacterized protein LOC112464084 [Temnothorax curvispinosus]|uniref:Uncharacterized protein LOC112464084 n=1 Tax=Temnothorax curvispinosus TaxID=300111 RepID=A0A6J1QWD2_9HYME|nr:uncharacterized protein LOC112464084 [Temnothorax curvispinosus]